MPDFLVFTLTGPMGSFGDLAGHEQRSSGTWPARSAVLGLIGAAQGIRRDDASGQNTLGIWRMAVGTLTLGAPLRDFHTVQAVPSARIRRPNSRAEALASLTPDDHPVLTTRDYLTDCAYSVALWGGDPAHLAEALSRPFYTPYLGRKACPLGAPMAPRIVTADNPLAALSAAQLPSWLASARPFRVMLDPWDGIDGRRETRWDEPQDRQLWHFAPREVVVVGSSEVVA
jgi:CRISPR system Cascade subunit CasD